MGLMDALRRAAEQSRKATRRRLAQACGEWEDAERVLRRKMRVHPQPEPQATSPNATPARQNRPIISIHGRDVAAEELGERKKTA